MHRAKMSVCVSTHTSLSQPVKVIISINADKKDKVIETHAAC